jgi:hypothetical protein
MSTGFLKYRPEQLQVNSAEILVPGKMSSVVSWYFLYLLVSLLVNFEKNVALDNSIHDVLCLMIADDRTSCTETFNKLQTET